MDPLSLAENAAKSLLSKLGTLLAEEARLLAGVRNDAQYIMDEPESMTFFMRALSEKQDHDLQVKIWLKQVRELAYDAEDTIDEFVGGLREPDGERGFMSSLAHYFQQLKILNVRHRLATELQSLKLRAHDVSERRARYDLKGAASSHKKTSAGGGGPNSSSSTTPHSPSFEEVKPVAIDDRRDLLIRWLLEENQLQFRVLSIVGFGGLGKTTLARMVYESSAVASSTFQALAWITVSQTFEIQTLLRMMTKQFNFTDDQIRDIFQVDQAKKWNKQKLENLMAERLNRMEEMQLKTMISEYVAKTSYVIFLDDIWSTDAWYRIKSALPSNGNNGSRVVVTTRIVEVAAKACFPNDQFIYEIPHLKDEQSWELFCKRVFDGPCHKDLEILSKDILKKRGGLPIAIVTVAGVLATKRKTTKVWEEFLRHMSFELETNPTLEGIKQVLHLSYNDLPYHLKLCLLYLGIFPEDYEINKKRLVRGWIAEGLVSARRDMSSEEVAETYFNELINRSLIQPAKVDYMGKVKTCRVHDIMLGLIVSLSMDDNFITVLDDRTKSFSGHGKIRRLSLQGSRDLRGHEYPNLSQLRSLTVFSAKIPLQDYGQARLLRVLDLQGCKGLTYRPLKTISKLFLLKFLSLRDTDAKPLPYAIQNLQNLEFLDIRGELRLVLPISIVKLKKLVCILSNQSMAVPRGIGKMRALKEFGIISVYDSDPRTILEMGELTELERLKASFDYHEIGRCFHGSDARKRKMKEFLDSLQKLLPHLRYLALRRPDGILHDLDSQSPAQLLLLEEVHIDFLERTLPSWFASLHRVAKITLSALQLGQDAIEILKGLPALVHLVFGLSRSQDLCFDRGGFECLKLLHLRFIGQIIFNEGALPNVEMLKLDHRSILHYGKISEHPVLGIEHLEKLKEVHLDGWMHAEIRGILESKGKHPEMKDLKKNGSRVPLNVKLNYELEIATPSEYMKQFCLSHFC